MYEESWKFISNDDIGSLFVSRFGHHSALGNQIIADTLFDYFR
jgi:hypothetical protein